MTRSRSGNSFPAAFGLTLCLVLATCAQNGGRGNNEGATAGSPRTSREGDYHAFSAPRPIGAGFLETMTLDGSAAYVSDTDPAFPQRGCEGQPEPVLFRQPLSGGPRELLGDAATPLKGRIVRGPDGVVALLDVCEGFFQSLAVGKESADGRINELREVMLGQVEGLASFSFSWTRDGKGLLAAVNDPAGPDGGPTRLIRIDPQNGAITPLFTGEGGSGVFQFAELEGGTYVLSANREVSFRRQDGSVVASFPGNGFEVFPDGKSIAVYGEAVAVAGEGSGEPRTLVQPRPDREISSAAISPDGKAVAFNRYGLQGSETEISVVTVGDGKTSVLVSGEGYGAPVFSGDGAALGFNQTASEPELSVKLMLARMEA